MASRKPRARPQKKPSSATFEDGDEPDRCRAKAKTRSRETGEVLRCARRKVPGWEVCRWHGAGGGRPIIHGRYSARLGRFREMYEASLEAGEGLFDLRETLALLDVHVKRAVERADQLDTPEFRRTAWQTFQRAQVATEAEEQGTILAQLGRLLRDGVSEDDAFDQLTKAAERLAVRQEKAWAIRLNASQALNARDLVTVMARLIDVIVQETPERAARIVERIDQEVLGGGEVKTLHLPPGS